jgi:hypothetical protein
MSMAAPLKALKDFYLQGPYFENVKKKSRRDFRALAISLENGHGFSL